MADRGTSNSPNTRNPQRPASHPSRLDQFADDLMEEHKNPGKGDDVTARKEKQKFWD